MDEAEFVALVDEVVASTEPPETLIDLLHESSRAFEGRAPREAAARKGWMLAAFGDAGLPEAAVPYVLEELATAREPYVAAGAAQALRGARSFEPRFGEHLATAFSNMVEFDDAVSFSGFRPDWTDGRSTTALEEILATLRATRARIAPSVTASLAAYLDHGSLSPSVRSSLHATIAAIDDYPDTCCDHGSDSTAAPTTAGETPPSGPGLVGVRAEDHGGDEVDVHDYLTGRTTVLGFFYTRCENPHKCPLTISKLGRTQRWLADHDESPAVQVAAITYDSSYDTPPRLARYASIYGFEPSRADRLLRITAGEERLRGHLSLNVGYAHSLVGRHGLELYLIGPDGEIARSWERELWSVDEVAAEAASVALQGIT